MIAASAAHAIGPALGLAQVHVEPRQECAAKHVVGGVERDDVALGIDRQQLSPRMLDCGAPGRLMSRIRVARGARAGR